MALSVRSLAHQYSKQCFDKLSKLLLDRNMKPATHTSSNSDFELDLEVVYDRRKKVENVVFK